MTVDTTTAPGRLSPEQIAAYLGLDPRRIETQVVVAVAGRYGLDPLLKHVIGIRSGGEIRPYITRDGLLHVAHASGQLDGIELVDGPTKRDDGHWHVTVAVYRKDWNHPVIYPGRYPARGGNEKYAPEMAIKVAECMALRRAFDVGGIPVAEEGPAWNTSDVDQVTGEIVAAQAHRNLAADTVDTGGRKATRRKTAKPQPGEDDPWATAVPAGDDTRSGTPEEGAARRGNESARHATARAASDRAASGSAVAPAGAQPPDTTPDPNGPNGRNATREQLRAVHTILGELGVTDREQGLVLIETIVGRYVESSKELSPAECSQLIDTLRDIAAQPDPQAAVGALTTPADLEQIPGQATIDDTPDAQQ